MITPLSVQLGRAIRHKAPVPIFKCSTLDIALRCVDVAKKTQKGLVLVFDTDSISELPLPVAMYYLTHYVKDNNVPVSIICDTSKDNIKLSELASFTNLTVLVGWDDAKRSRFHLKAAGMERIIITDEIPEPEVTTYLIQKYDLAGLCYAGEKLPFDSLSAARLSKAARAMKVPFLLANQHLPKWTYPKLIPAKIAGVIFDDLLDKTYTAGVRTALRDRFVHNPGEYLEKGLLAVESVVQNYLNHPYNLDT